MSLIHSRYYPSLDALVEAAHGPSEMQTTRRSSRDAEGGFHGAPWDDASKWARKGDMDGARRLKPALLNSVNSYVHGQKRLDPVYRLDEGQWIDVARYVKGEPECWGAMVEADPTPRRGAAIVFNIAARGHVDSARMDRVGQEVGAAILGLQATGHCVTLYLVACSDGFTYPTPTSIIGAPVNPGGGPLDVAKMSTILRPWFFRRIIFSLKETYEARYRSDFRIGDGYGSARPVTVSEVKALFHLTDKPVIVDMQTATKDPTCVREIILKQIKGA